MKEYGKLYQSEIKEFKELGEKFLAGELTVAEFKGKSGGMGVYAQRGKQGFMIRLRTPGGIITYEHMKLVEKYLDQYHLQSLHLTSRQAIQLHDMNLNEVCEIMEDAIHYDLFTRGGGGNYPRNVALSPMSGVEKEEVFDVTDFAMQVSEYFISNASTYHLPRKLKVAFSNSPKDTACATINDLGFLATIKEDKPYFHVFMAGGMGKDPAISLKYPKLIAPEEAIYYVEAYIRTFKELGDYENRSKARSRYIPRRIGENDFLECFEKHLKKVKQEESFERVLVKRTNDKEWTCKEPDTKNRKAQKQPNLYTVILHPRFGKISTKDYHELCHFVDRCKQTKQEQEIELRISMEQELYVRNLTFDQSNELLDLMKEDNQTTSVTQSVSCVGVPTCQIGIQNSRALLLSILEMVEKNALDGNLLPRIHISGCPNSCSRHQVAELGFAGKKQNLHGQIFDVYEVYAGGVVKLEQTKMGKYYGTITVDNIPGFILELGQKIEEEELCFEKFYDTREEEFSNIISKYLVTV